MGCGRVHSSSDFDGNQLGDKYSERAPMASTEASPTMQMRPSCLRASNECMLHVAIPTALFRFTTVFSLGRLSATPVHALNVSACVSTPCPSSRDHNY